MPGTAALLTTLIGLSDILNILRPDLVNRLHRFNTMIPGALNTVTRSADVLIGLMLLMLAHGLRRRKRRAWQAVAALLAFDVAIHFIHTERIPTAVVAIVVLVALLYFRDEFYAEGDPRTRWRALWAFGGLIVADVVIGLTYILLARGLAEDYPFGQRVQEVIYGLVGVSGPGAVGAGDPRRPVQHPHQRARHLHPAGHRLPVPAPGRAAGPAERRRTRAGSGTCWPSTATGTRSATSRCATTRA